MMYNHSKSWDSYIKRRSYIFLFRRKKLKGHGRTISPLCLHIVAAGDQRRLGSVKIK